MVSEYLDGEDLATHLKVHGPLTAEEVVLLANPICAALEHLRQRGLTARALHPDLVFLSGGLAAFSPKLIGPGLTDFPVERAGPHNARADVFAVGALMYEAFTGLPLPLGKEPFERTGAPGQSDWLQAVIRRCVSPRPEERFASPLEVARALAGYLPNTQLHESSAPPVAIEESLREKEGDILGSYQLVRLLGEGAMGRVFLARHIKLGRAFALKVLRVEHAKNGGLIQRFFQEAKAVNQINHENIIEIFDFVEETGGGKGGRVYCVMEMLEGKSLTEVLKSGPLSVARAVGIARQVCRALAAAHQVGVVHRDVKPDNLVVSQRSGQDFVKVLDFGVAKLLAPLADMSPSTTVEGTIIGTPTYMSPEQASGLETDGRTDIYAVGTVLYEMLCGHPPFQGPTFNQLVAQVITFPPPPLPSTTPAGERIPAGLKSLVMRCLEKNPTKRFSTMPELAQALEPFEAEPGRIPVHSLRSMLPAMAGGLIAAGVLLAVWRATSLTTPPLPPTALPPVTLSAAAQAPRGASGVLEPAITLKVSSTPQGARVTAADTGTLLGFTPLVQRLPKKAGELRVRLEAPGHQTIERIVALNTDTDLDVELATPAHHRPGKAGGKKSPERAEPGPMVDPFSL